jgi:hypothetical protein
MVSGGVSDYAARSLLVCKLRYCVEGATKLESADPLKIFALQKNIRSHRFVEDSGSHNRGDIGVASQSFSGRFDSLKHPCSILQLWIVSLDQRSAISFQLSE